MAQAKIYWDRENYQAVEKVNVVFFKPIFGRCPHLFIPPENTRKQKVFTCFQGVWKCNIGVKWVNSFYIKLTISSFKRKSHKMT